MAPCSNSTNYISLKLSDKEKHKLRKPVVEKMRRDRINSCIEQLKKLLEKEFHRQDPNAKLEKADVLEMTVSFLKQQLQPQPALSQGDYREGYSQCWRETLHFLSVNSKGDVPLHQLHRYHGVRRASKDLCTTSPALSQQSPAPLQQSTAAKQLLWRPW
ncbi:transcription factor HES-5-like [Megalops cyprinoides]|uniref:transcription factor HES-5-like n=1 Tax=Megalops cyprinoides TaxID=118141 RepID=UPI0018654118|nr:transcription factor HES-5-like [Megalops cyprinoides]